MKRRRFLKILGGIVGISAVGGTVISKKEPKVQNLPNWWKNHPSTWDEKNHMREWEEHHRRYSEFWHPRLVYGQMKVYKSPFGIGWAELMNKKFREVNKSAIKQISQRLWI